MVQLAIESSDLSTATLCTGHALDCLFLEGQVIEHDEKTLVIILDHNQAITTSRHLEGRIFS